MNSLEHTIEENEHISDNFQALLAQANEEALNPAPAPVNSDLEVDVDAIAVRNMDAIPVPSMAELMEQRATTPLQAPVMIPETILVETKVEDATILKSDIQVKKVKSKTLDADKFKRGMNKFKRPAKTSFPITSLNSYYRARVASISLAQKENLLDTTLLAHEIINARASIIYNLITDMTIGRPSFSTWKKITAVSDLETFFFGIYGATYPSESEFTLTCTNKKCKGEIKLKVKPSDFVIDIKEEAIEQMENIIRSSSSLEQVSSNSPVFAQKTYYFGEDQEYTVTAAMSVSVDRYIQTLQSFTPAEQQKMFELINIVSAIKSVGYRVDDGTTGEIEYNESDDIRNILDFISDESFSPSWANTIEKDIVAAAEPLEIKYNLPPTKCPHCDTAIEKTPINPQNVLFFKLEGKKM